TDEHNETHLHVDIIFNPRHPGESKDTKDSRRDRENDREWQDVAFILGCQEEVHEDYTQQKYKSCLGACPYFLARHARPFVRISSWQVDLCHFFNRFDGVS